MALTPNDHSQTGPERKRKPACLTLLVRENLADKLGGAARPGTGEKVVGVPGVHQRALVHEHDPVGHLSGETRFMGNHAHGHFFTGQFDHDGQHIADHFGGQGAGGIPF
jgi:hypothetical protein